MRQLEQQALTLDVSPGGAADMLAATLFLDSLTLGQPAYQKGEARAWKE
jgi:triphosphoribosyl-dephospho-CoA synthetase